MVTPEDPRVMIQKLLVYAGLPDEPEQPIMDEEEWRECGVRIQDAMKEELRKWDRAKQASREAATRIFLD